MRMSRARNWSIAIAALLASLVAFDVGVAFADAPPPAAPDLAQRVADLEAYVTNGAPKFMTTTSGPGHNAWMMTSAALVLFMTLPGLALFYGGLVRKKNVLSVLAQCLGCAGLVTHPVVGRRLQPRASPRRTPFLGGLKFAFLKGVDFGAQHRLRLLGLAERLLDVPDDVRHHHAGADRRRDRRAHEVLGDHGVHRRLDVRRLLPAGPHGLGHRRPDERRVERQREDQGDRLRGRHRRPHVVGLVGADPVPDPRQAAPASARRLPAAQHGR